MEDCRQNVLLNDPVNVILIIGTGAIISLSSNLRRCLRNWLSVSIFYSSSISPSHSMVRPWRMVCETAQFCS